ncbi:uncharacterized protein ACR2FA_002057 [Aphomia sociella]
MKDNIHVVSSTISTFNNTIQKLNNNEQTLNSNMEKLDKILENMLQSTDKLAVTNQLALTFSALESSLMTINFNLENIIDSILFGKQNIVHPSVLSPIELYDELSSNQNHIAQNFPLPLHLDNIHTLLDISDISSFINDTKLIFVVRIPLVLLTEYNLYHLYALPTAHDINNPSSFAMINPTAKYLAITDDKLTYSILDSVSECKVISKNKHLCKLNNILSTITSPICEVTILTEYVNKIPDTCNYKVIIGDVSVWQKLNYNKWIYVQSHITKLTINCDDKINDYDIVGTGILTLSKNCKAFHKLLQFIPSVEYESKLYLPVPKFNIIEDDCCSKKRVNSTLPYLTPVKLSHINLDSLQYASHRLNYLNDELTKIENQPYHVTYGSYFSILTTVVSLIIFTFILYKIYKKCCSQKIQRNHTPSSGCCVNIFNNCYNKPNNNTTTRTSSLELSNRISSNTENSPNSIRRNLEY